MANPNTPKAPLDSSKCTTKQHKAKTLRIVTFVFCEENYGQILQAYALQRSLRDNYPKFDTKVIWGLPQAFSKKLYYFHRICGDSIYRFVRACKKRVLGSRIQESQAELDMRKRRGFNEFKQSHIALHASRLQHYILPQKRHYPELSGDIFITGSDQQWNDWNTAPQESLQGYAYSWLPYFTLEFAKLESTKIAYAASFGKRVFKNQAQKDYFKNVLTSFTAISTREQAGVTMLESIGIESTCVPDPTMLLDREHYCALIDSATLNLPSNLSESIFIYTYGDSAFGGDLLPKILGKYANVVAVASTYNPSDTYNATIQEWLACVKECKLMVTGSFHGTCFAIMMNTPFFLMRIQDRASESLNTRFETLLEVFELQDRMVSSLEELESKIKENPPIDWGKVNERLKAWRKVGQEFLAKELEPHHASIP